MEVNIHGAHTLFNFTLHTEETVWGNADKLGTESRTESEEGQVVTPSSKVTVALLYKPMTEGILHHGMETSRLVALTGIKQLY